MEHLTLGRWVIRPSDPANQRIILKIVGFLYWKFQQCRFEKENLVKKIIFQKFEYVFIKIVNPFSLIMLTWHKKGHNLASTHKRCRYMSTFLFFFFWLKPWPCNFQKNKAFESYAAGKAKNSILIPQAGGYAQIGHVQTGHA